MNPYKAPGTEAPAIEAETLLIRVRYGRYYPLFLLLIGLLFLAGGFHFQGLIGSGSRLLLLSGALHLALAVLTMRAVYFDVFPDRIEYLSPLFQRWRRARPHEAIRPLFLQRWIAHPEDFERFLDLRSGGKG